MENKGIVKQMIDLQKMSLKKSFSTVEMLQTQTEKFMKTFVDLTPGIGDEGKKAVSQWTEAYKKWIDDLQKSIDGGYDKVAEFFDGKTMIMFQDQTEKIFNTFINQKNWMSLDLRKTMEQWADNYKKGCDEFNRHLDENIRRMENFYPGADKPQTNNKHK